MYFNRLRLILIMFLAVFAQNATAMGVHLFTSDSDLSSTLINQVYVDSNGFVWIATEAGLNRFDGSKIVNYKHKTSDPTSLQHDFVNSVFEDADGNIYVCTHSGIQLYDKLNDCFITTAVNTDGTQFSSSVKNLLQTPSGQIYAVGNRVYTMSLDGKTMTLARVPDTEDITNLTSAVAGADGKVWLIRGTQGIACIDTGKGGKIKKYHNQPIDSRLECAAFTPDGRLMVGSDNGVLYIHNKATDTFDRIDNAVIKGRFISAIDCTKEGDKMYLATDGSGLYSYDPGTGEIVRVELPFWSDSKLKIHSLARDSYDNQWFGLYQKGLLLIPSRDSGFTAIDQRSGKYAYIGQACVSSLLRDADGTLWVGTDNDGLYSMSTDFMTSRHYYEGVPKVIMRLYRDTRGNLWVGSYDAGCGILDQRTGAFNKITLSDEHGNGVPRVYAFAETPDGLIWIATMGNGIYRYNPATRVAEHIDIANPEFNPWTGEIVYSPIDKNLYIGSYDGLYRLNPKSLQVEVLNRGIIVTSITEDPDTHNLWLGTSSGLALSVNGSPVSRQYTVDDGLPSNSIYAIQKSGDNLWISTNCGLSKFNIKDETFTNYDVNEGLQSNEFYKNSTCVDAEGNIFFGGINGLSFFKPADIRSSGRKLDLRITDFYIAGESVKNGLLSDGRRVIDKPIYEATEFHLSHRDNSFAIEFSTKQLAGSGTVDYYYSFDGSKWEKIPGISLSTLQSDGNILTFNKIKSGRHTLSIKAVDNGIESDILSVDIIVDYPWYATWWAYMLYILVTAAVITYIWYRMRQHAALRQHDLERRHEAEIKEAKLQFFTNISHEIRTPLTLVMSPLQKLMGEDSDTGRQKVYRTILRNSQRIHKLVNELMDLRKIDNRQMKLRYRQIDITGFLNDLYETFLPAANRKSINLQFLHPECDNLEAWVDPSNFDKIVMNLLSNAVKFTPTGGSITMTLSRGSDPAAPEPLREYFDITVTDTGIGIPEADMSRIFERFYQSDNNKIGGTGIGLHLTHSLVKLHKGEITIKANPEGKGTCFTVRLPMGNSHLKADDYDSSQSRTVDRQVTELNTIIADQAIIPEPEKATPPSHSMVVYVVDDDTEIRNYLVQVLGEKFKVEAFVNGAEALEAVHRARPDLLITDVMMPDMDGITLASKIRQNVNINHIPIIMLSAKNREEDKLEGLETGIDAYITKPFNVDILMRTAINLLNSRRILRNVYSGTQNQSDKVEEIKVVSSDEKLLERVMKVVNKNIGNPNITVEMIAQEIGISRVHLHRKLKELTNQSTRDFVRNIRLQQAAKLLREKKLSVAEVSDFVGFKHPNNFSTNFKELFGMSPSAYADMHHGTPRE